MRILCLAWMGVLGLCSASAELEAQSAIRYPYVENGDIVVSRDAVGGVRAEYLRDVGQQPWTETPDHAENSKALNIVASRFQVAAPRPDAADAMHWAEASAFCSQLQESGFSDWRVPTQRELMLIYVVNDQLSVPLYDKDPRPDPPDPDKAVFYWSATRENGNATRVWTLGLSADNPEKEGKVEPDDGTSGLNYVRCVRDVAD